MYILTRKNRVIDYCESGYLYVGNIVVCNDKNCNFEDATIVEVDSLPEDIDSFSYDYINGEFVRVDSKETIVEGDSTDSVASYLAFVGNINANMVSSAFGKNNEEDISGIGEALAMYAYYKGTDETEYPFINLQNMQTLNDMNFDVYDEIINNTYLTSLIKGNSYALGKVFDSYTVQTDRTSSIPMNTSRSATIDFTIGEEDLQHPFSLSYNIHDTNNVYISSGYIAINGVTAISSGGGSETNIVREWDEFNITAPGTYTMKVSFTVTGYQTSISSNNAYANVTIVKAKEIYRKEVV